MVAGRYQVVAELGNPRLVGNRRARIGSRWQAISRIVPPQPVNVVHVLGSCVVRLEVLIADRPSWQDAVVMVQLSEITFPEAMESAAPNNLDAPPTK